MTPTVRLTANSPARLWAATSLLISLVLGSCQSTDPSVGPSPATNQLALYNQSVATNWAQLQLLLTKTTGGFGPPVAARAFGIAGLTMYESIAPAISNGQSLVGQLNGLSSLPKPEAGQSYNWAVCLTAGQASILKNLYPTTSAANLAKIDSLEQAMTSRYAAGTSANELTRSVEFGRSIAVAIFSWAKTDGGHEAYKNLFPVEYVPPTTVGSWQPTEDGRKIPMLPYWGKNRTMLAVNADLPMVEPIAYSTDAQSQYFAQYLDVYTKNKALTSAEKQIAVWWADNPGQTFTPAGHSYSLAGIAAKATQASLAKTVEGFCRVGLAVNDAFISCWKCKYKFNNERPYTYVRQVIDPNWQPFWAAPPFPGYSSGHATQSMAAAEVLTALYGSGVTFTDDTHLGRSPEFGTIPFTARSYQSFYETAEESAYSRFLGGIHTRQDNEIGMQDGRRVGRNVNALKFSS